MRDSWARTRCELRARDRVTTSFGLGFWGCFTELHSMFAKEADLEIEVVPHSRLDRVGQMHSEGLNHKIAAIAVHIIFFTFLARCDATKPKQHERRNF